MQKWPTQIQTKIKLSKVGEFNIEYCKMQHAETKHVIISEDHAGSCCNNREDHKQKIQTGSLMVN